MSSRELRVRYLGEKILPKMQIFLVLHPECVGTDKKGYATFDDPTGGKDGDTSGPVRTMLAFSSEFLCETYIDRELNGVGGVERIDITRLSALRLARMMLASKIYWFCFDRTSDEKSCWFIRIELFLEIIANHFGIVDESMKKQWTPEDSRVADMPDSVRKAIEGP